MIRQRYQTLLIAIAFKRFSVERSRVGSRKYCRGKRLFALNIFALNILETSDS
ncbi:hypothetical protein [Brunnivagina elsteri]|uniref:hypothetical protein n=1 Tax=Brunnivagina elsteri TaxID=1247191 RepID=UPI0013044071|nr:hypothetical protein [Calothrix elsteri]